MAPITSDQDLAVFRPATEQHASVSEVAIPQGHSGCLFSDPDTGNLFYFVASDRIVCVISHKQIIVHYKAHCRLTSQSKSRARLYKDPNNDVRI